MTVPTPDGAPADPVAAAQAAKTAAETSTAAAAVHASTARMAAAQPLGVLDALQSIWHELPGLVSDRVDLLSLELQRAGSALAQIVALLVAAAILGVTAWLALCAGLAVGLVELGLHWALALLLVLVLNAGFAMLALTRLRALLPLLRLPATRRHLTPGRTSAPEAPAAPAGAEPGAALGRTG